MEYLLIGLQLAIILFVFLFWRWLKQLPAAVHKRQEFFLKQRLDKEVELLKISQAEIQLRKIERFIDFAKIQTNILTNSEFKAKLQSNDSAALSELNELIVELGIGLFFFASDSTVREYGSWKAEAAMEGARPYAVLAGLGKLMVALRRDVGYDTTELDGGDYLKLFITDWEEIKSQVPHQN